MKENFIEKVKRANPIEEAIGETGGAPHCLAKAFSLVILKFQGCG